MLSGSPLRRLLVAGLIIALLGLFFDVIVPRLTPWLTLTPQNVDGDGLPVDIRLSGSPTLQTLSIDGQVVLERAGSHFGRPRISPDGTLMAITVVPTGTETVGLAEIYVIERATGRVRERIPGHNPRWQTGRSNRLRFDQLEANGIRSALYDPTNRSIIREDNLQPDDNPPGVDPASLETASLTYPATIRVAHHPENNCRNVPDWQVDVIPFEEYVARSVPAEVPISWSPEALAAQAIATRTYAWYQIQRNRRYYDVTDWANFQMMCNNRFSSTDAAVSRTAGQYLAYSGDSTRAPIIAMYSAKNSHPTLTNPAVPYLQAVPDETGLGEVRWGHGYGLSQWGAARRGTAGQTYRQILGHYYTDVTLQNASQPTQAIGGLIGQSLKGYIPVGGLRWGALVPAEPLSGTVDLDPGPDSLPIRGVWLRSADITSGSTITVSLTLSNQLQEQKALQVDWDAPSAPTFEAPSAVEVQRAMLTLATPEKDALIGLSNNWIWQGEDLYSTTGEVVDDAAADGNRAREARADDHELGWWYGPYATDIPHGATYRVLFRLRRGEPDDDDNDNVLPDQPIAHLDVTDKGGTVRLGLRDIWPSDFTGANEYVEIPVDFHLFNPIEGIEFRVKWFGETDLALDRVQLWQLQNISTKTKIDWALPNTGVSTVSAIAFDTARNASPVVTKQIEFGSEQPPVFGDLEHVQNWWTRLPVLISVPVQDFNSGLDSTSGRLLLGDEEKSAVFSLPNDPLAAQKLSASLTDLADGAYTVRFRAKDRSGLQGESDAGQLRIDRTAPTVEAQAVLVTPDTTNEGEASGDGSTEQLSASATPTPTTTPTPTPTATATATASGVFSGTVQVTIEAEDATSGVWGIAYVINDGSVVLYSEPFTISADGVYNIRYWAKDNAGNYSSSQRLRVWVRSGSSTSGSSSSDDSTSDSSLSGSAPEHRAAAHPSPVCLSKTICLTCSFRG